MIKGNDVHFHDLHGEAYCIETGSPMEALLLEAIIAELPADTYYEETHQGNNEWGFNLFGAPRSDDPPFLLPQFTVGAYRLDFAVIGFGEQLAIEVDGHDFHERTREQAQRDRKRDRYLQHHGWCVIRFTGSEVFQDAQSCAREILDFRRSEG